MTTLYVVRFASGLVDPRTGKKAKPRIMLISEAEHDRWCECEPPQGYEVFDTLHSFDCEHVTAEALAAIHELMVGEAE